MKLPQFCDFSQLKSFISINKDIIIPCFFLLILGVKFTTDAPSGLFPNVEKSLTTYLCLLSYQWIIDN